MLQDVWSYTKILDFDNLFDFGYLAAGWVAILRQLWNLESLEKPFMSLYCGMSWLRILWILRGALWERTVTQILHGRSGRSTLNPYNICYPGIAPDVRNIWNATFPFAPTWTQVHIHCIAHSNARLEVSPGWAQVSFPFSSPSRIRQLFS